MKIKMIVTDLDNTLLYNDETLPGESIEIINRCKEKGVLFVVATSRSIASAKTITDKLKPDAVISSGGANAMCDNNIIYDAMLSVEDSNRLVKQCINDNKIEFIRIAGEKVDLTNNPDIRLGEKEYGHYIRTDFEVIPEQRIYKITIYSSDIEHVSKMFEKDERCCLITSYSGKNIHKLTHSKATKEDALSEVLKYFGSGFNDVLSFGDDTSDMNMLYLSKIGVAVDNAKQSVKDAANDICDSNEKKGVLKYLADHFEYLFEDKNDY